MKILHIAPDYPHSKLYHQLISALESEECKNEVYVQSEAVQLERHYPVYYLGRDFGTIDRLLFFRKQYIIYHDIINRHLTYKMDIIHAHNLFTGGYNAMKLKQKTGIPYIVAVRNTDVNTFFQYMIHLRSLGANVMREADAVIFLSPVYRDFVINNYVPSSCRKAVYNKCHIIPNGLDPYFMDNKALKPRELFGDKTVRLIYVGDIDKNKNVETTIKACKWLMEKDFKVTFDVIGHIKDKKQETIKNIEFVNYHPYSPKEKILEYLNQADIFVMPSIHETFGLVYIEAMSQGLPVIYSQGQGFDGYYDEGKVGYHVPCFDEKAIADSIVKIMEDYSRISDTCIKAVDDFSWQKKAEEYKSLYKEIIQIQNKN